MNENNINSENTDLRNTSSGTLVVQLSEAERVIPLPGGLVQITKDEPEGQMLYGSLITDRDGKTPPVELPAPAAEESLTPSAQVPYEIYYVRASHPGFYTEENHMVQIFGGSNSYLSINMISLPDGAEKDVIML